MSGYDSYNKRNELYTQLRKQKINLNAQGALKIIHSVQEAKLKNVECLYSDELINLSKTLIDLEIAVLNQFV